MMRTAVLACICGIIVCATAMVRDNEFTPADLPCGHRILFDVISYHGDQRNVGSYWIAKYGRFMAETGSSVDSGISFFNVIRLDMHDPADPDAAAYFEAYSFGQGSGSCHFWGYSPYEQLYDKMTYYNYFNETFEFTSNNDDDEWEGQSCKSFSDDQTTLYVNDQDRVIAVVVRESATSNYTLRAITYEETAEGRFFKMPSKMWSSECLENDKKAVYSNPTTKEGNCELTPDSDVFVPAKLPCAFKITYEEIVQDEDQGERTFNGWFAMYGRYMAMFQEGMSDGRMLKLYETVRLDISDPKE